MDAGLTVFVTLIIYLTGISKKDIELREISNCAPIIVIMASPFLNDIPIVERLIGFCGIGIFLLAANLLTNGFGMGDVKLCAAFGFLLGAIAECAALVAALTAAVIFAKIKKYESLPLAPFLCSASMAALVITEVMIC